MSHESRVNAVAFSPDGRYLVTANRDGTTRVREMGSGREIARMIHGVVPEAVAFSPDGRYLATGTSTTIVESNAEVKEGGHVVVWEMKVAPMQHEDEVYVVAFSPDGRYLATASYDNTARVWETVGGQEVARLSHESRVNAVVFSPDGRYLATASKDHTAGVWEAVSGQQVARVTHENVVNTVIFSPDGRYLATASKDHTARVWLWRPDDLIAEACARLTRDLSREEWQQYLGEELYRKTCLLRQLL